MSKADERQQRLHELDRFLTEPIPTPASVPPYRRCVEAGFLPHEFGPAGMRGDVCWYCMRTREQILAGERAYEAAHLAEAS